MSKEKEEEEEIEPYAHGLCNCGCGLKLEDNGGLLNRDGTRRRFIKYHHLKSKIGFRQVSTRGIKRTPKTHRKAISDLKKSVKELSVKIDVVQQQFLDENRKLNEKVKGLQYQMEFDRDIAAETARKQQQQQQQQPQTQLSQWDEYSLSNRNKREKSRPF